MPPGEAVVVRLAPFDEDRLCPLEERRVDEGFGARLLGRVAEGDLAQVRAVAEDVEAREEASRPGALAALVQLRRDAVRTDSAVDVGVEWSARPPAATGPAAASPTASRSTRTCASSPTPEELPPNSANTPSSWTIIRPVAVEVVEEAEKDLERTGESVDAVHEEHVEGTETSAPEGPPRGLGARRRHPRTGRCTYTRATSPAVT
jgi:hypothetical protein